MDVVIPPPCHKLSPLSFGVSGLYPETMYALFCSTAVHGACVCFVCLCACICQTFVCLLCVCMEWIAKGSKGERRNLRIYVIIQCILFSRRGKCVPDLIGTWPAWPVEVIAAIWSMSPRSHAQVMPRYDRYMICLTDEGSVLGKRSALQYLDLVSTCFTLYTP